METDPEEVSCELHDGTRLPHGTYIGACLGIDHIVRVSFSFNIEVSAERYDIGLYIETSGRSVLDSGSSCSLSPLIPGTYGDVIITKTEVPPDNSLTCADLDDDLLVDFDLGISWYQREGGKNSENLEDVCGFDYSNTTSPPFPGATGTSSKCWHTSTSSGNDDLVGRVNLPSEFFV